MQSALNRSEVVNPDVLVVLKVSPILLSLLMHQELKYYYFSSYYLTLRLYRRGRVWFAAILLAKIGILHVTSIDCGLHGFAQESPQIIKDQKTMQVQGRPETESVFGWRHHHLGAGRGGAGCAVECTGSGTR